MITRPTLVVKEDICRNNIRRMAGKAGASDVVFRPHFKTHQSVVVGEWFRDEGVERITVSSAEMAVKFADAGWEDITIAFPVNIRESNTCNELAKKIWLNLLVDAAEVVELLSQKMDHLTGIFIEVDCGYGRSGIQYDDTEGIGRIVAQIKASEKLRFEGFLTHDGNTYHAESKQDIIDIHNTTVSRLKELKALYPEALISVGDTPACSIMDEPGGADEIRPGNFVYYDLMQEKLGSCRMNDIAVSVACPVAGIYPERNELVIYGGAVHLSKEYLDGKNRIYGLVVQYHDDGWTTPVPDTALVSISQEHGVIKTSPKFLQTLNYGDLLGILPVHSCLTANLLQENTLIRWR